MSINFKKITSEIENLNPIYEEGIVTKVIGLTIEAKGFKGFVGERCIVLNTLGEEVNCEIVGFKNGSLLLMPLGELTGIGEGCIVIPQKKPLVVGCSDDLIGKVLDGLGNPIDKSEINCEKFYPLENKPPNPLLRREIDEILPTGVRAIDSLITCGEGQRVGIFAGSGVGKSTTLGMIAKQSEADINVICLIGERGREVLEFINRDLGEEGIRKSIIVCATSEQPPLVRVKSALTATAIAEYFRDKGKKVIFMMDSVTRFAMAQREIGLAIGEPPAQKGYTPSVFAMLPKLLERTGNGEIGSITAFYTVLVDGDDFNEPISDAVRGILDGHIVLSRSLAHKNHYPAIDVLNSISRLMMHIIPDNHKAVASDIRELISRYRESEEFINIGAYVRGSNPKVDLAIKYNDKINMFLKQSVNEMVTFEDTMNKLYSIFKN